MTRFAAGGILAVLLLSACGERQEAPEAAAPPADTAATLDPLVMQRWSQSCALCHVTGEGGAPRVGNEEEWGPRLAKGRDVLLQHTLEGFNNMPPLGYCMSCERTDFLALIDFMTENR